MDTSPIRQAVIAAGGQGKLAALLGIATPMVWQWVNARRPVPAKYAIPIETATGISRHLIAPQVFGDRAA